MSDKMIVVVSDRDDGGRGEISVVDDAATVERMVERLLEAGIEQERIRVFAGRQTEFQVSSRPVVALVAEGYDEEPPQPAAITESELQASGPPADPEAGGDDDAGAEGETEAEAGDEGTTESESEKEEAGVRFSSLFRSA